MGMMNPAGVRINDAGPVLNADGQAAPVLHQYDRISGLKEDLVATCMMAENSSRARHETAIIQSL